MNQHGLRELDRVTASVADAWNGALAPIRRLYTVAIAVLVLFWSTVVVIVVVTFALTAWSDRAPADQRAVSPPAMTETARPPGVPAAAQIVERDLVLGDVADFIYFFANADCAGSIETITTTKAIVYAETSCAAAIPQGASRRLLGQPVRIRIVGGKVLLEALFVGVFQIDASRIWVELR